MAADQQAPGRNGSAEDLIIGLSNIAKEVGVTAEGVRHLWREGRIPAVHFGSLWLANRSALAKALENDAVRRQPGRRPKEEEAAREAIRAKTVGGKTTDTQGRKEKL